MQNEKLIKRLQKIKVLSERGVGGEAENAAKLLARMLAKNRMNMEDISFEDEEEEEVVKDAIDIANASWRRILMHAVAIYFDCRFAYNTRGSDTIVGHTEDIKCSIYLYDVACGQIEASARNAKGLGQVHGRRGMNIYRNSMVSGFRAKLTEIKEEVKDETAGYGIVLRSRAKKVTQFVEDNLNFKSGRKIRIGFNSEAFEKGKRIKINSGVEGSQANKRIE